MKTIEMMAYQTGESAYGWLCNAQCNVISIYTVLLALQVVERVRALFDTVRSAKVNLRVKKQKRNEYGREKGPSHPQCLHIDPVTKWGGGDI